MKICDLTQFYSPVSGGVRRYVEQKVRHVIEHSDTNEHILVIPGATNACETQGRAKIYTIASPLISKTSRYRALFNLNLVEEVLEREKPDIIESGDPYQLAWKAIASGRALSIPVVGFYHSHFPEAYIRSVAKYFGKLSVIIADDVSRRYVKALYNRLERTFVPSPALAALLGEWGVENVANIDLGVETGIFYPNKDAGRIVRQQLGVPEDRILLLYVGRLAQEKNVRTLLEAFQMLHASQPNRYVLLTIGDGALRQSVLRLKETTQAVHWLSYCGNAKELADYYRAADLFVHPSVNETFGLVTIESQASGTPVVGIRGSYMDRIIFSPQTHWAPENTPEALATAVQMISQQDLRAVGLAASQEVRQRYSWDGVFSRLFSIYQEVIDGYIN